MAVAHQGMGINYRKLGLFEKALECFQREREIVLHLHGADHVPTATSYETVGSVFYAMKKYEEALVQHQRALEIRTRMLPPNNPITQNSVAKIAGCLMKMGGMKRRSPFSRNSAFLQKGPETRLSSSNWNSYLAHIESKGQVR